MYNFEIGVITDILDEEESSLVNQSAAKIGTEEDSLKETDLTEEEKTELQLNGEKMVQTTTKKYDLV